MTKFIGIHEVRLMRSDRRIAVGYFDSYDAAIRTVESEPDAFIAAWATLNPIMALPGGQVLNPPALRIAGNTASDADISRRTALLIDCDPIRPAKTNSTAAEKAASHSQAVAVRDSLLKRGWPTPVLADSGNGTQLIFNIDLANDDASRELIRNVLNRLARLFDTAKSKIDVGNFNAGRVCKLYPSWTRKGPHSEERPHRRSAILELPEWQPVSLDLLTALASEHRKAEERKSELVVSNNEVKLQRLIGFIDHYGLEAVSKPRTVKGGWSIDIVCPWVNEHSSESNRESAVAHIPGLGYCYNCFHSHCVDRHWHELNAELVKRNPSLPPYWRGPRLPRLVHSEIARSFIEDTENFVCVYDQDAETAVWVGTRWAIGDKGDYLLRRALRDYLDKLYPMYPEPEDAKKDPRRTLLQSPFLSHVLMEVKPLLPKKSRQDFDADAWLLAIPEGQVIDLSEGTVRAMDRADCITRRINVSPVAGPTERFDQFLDEVTCGNKELAAYLVRLCGLCLSGHPEQILVFFWGKGRNGKGVLLRLLANLLGPYAVSLRPNEVTYSKEDGDRMKRTFAKLAGKRLAVVNESVGKRLNLATLKLLSGGDKISGAKMRQDDYETDPTHKIILPTNDRPELPADPAIRGRLHFVPFLGDFSGDKGDRFIEDKLWAEREAILHKLIIGCAEAKRGGLQPPAIVLAATAELMDEMDLAGQFIADCATTGNDEYCTPRAKVEAAIRAWLPGVNVNDWRVDRIISELKTRFRFERRYIGKERPWCFVGLSLETGS
jgi:P4 family phage/plasmid primase-like protien